MADVIEQDPFRNIKQDDYLKPYICFFAAPVVEIPELPVVSEKEGPEIIQLDDKFAFIISRPVGKNRYGFPNNFIEKELSVSSISRYWKTLLKMMEKFG